MLTTIGFSLIVNGVVFEKRMAGKQCTCSSVNKDSSSKCYVDAFEFHHKFKLKNPIPMIVLLDADENPINGKVEVVCVGEDK